jgi:hypothetical protein
MMVVLSTGTRCEHVIFHWGLASGATTLSVTTFSITTLGIMTFSIVDLIVTLVTKHSA